MSFDDEVDEVKREMQTAKLDPEARRASATKLSERLKEQIASRRLDFALAEENGDPIVQVKYKPDGEVLASVYVNEDGSITFQAAGASEGEVLASVYVNEDGSITFQAAGASDEAEDEDEDAGYFPSYVEYMDEDEFLEDAYDMLKVGIAEYELDREQR